MMTELRTVIDTNVVVSAAFLPMSVSRKAFDWALSSGRILASEATIAELQEVLSRPKFVKYISETRRLEFFDALVHSLEIVTVMEQIRECRDPKDNMFLSLAICGRATHLVSGDSDLLTLNPFRGIAVVTPSKFITVT